MIEKRVRALHYVAYGRRWIIIITRVVLSNFPTYNRQKERIEEEQKGIFTVMSKQRKIAQLVV